MASVGARQFVGVERRDRTGPAAIERQCKQRRDTGALVLNEAPLHEVEHDTEIPLGHGVCAPGARHTREHGARAPWLERNDEKTPLTVPGTITESSYTNPHGTIKLRATDGGKVWDVVLAPVARMQTRGLTEAMLKPGTVVTVLGYQHRKVGCRDAGGEHHGRQEEG